MDVFIEQIIETKSDSRRIVLRVGLIAAIVLLSGVFVFAALLFPGPFSVIAIAAIFGVIWLGISLIKGSTVEYEYILTNKELDIDKIKGRSKRKRLVTFNLLNAEKLDIYSDDTSISADVTVSAHDNTYTHMWYLLIKHDLHGDVVLLFNPNDAFVTKLNNALPLKARVAKFTQKGDDGSQ